MRTTLYASLFIHTIICLLLLNKFTDASENPCGFTLHPRAASWHGAKDNCTEAGMQMVTIETPSKQQHLNYWLTSDAQDLQSQNLWLGARHNGTGRCEWVTGKQCLFTNWQDNSPKADCLAVWSRGRNTGKWGSVLNCQILFPYICEPLEDTCGTVALSSGAIAGIVLVSLLLLVGVGTAAAVVVKKKTVAKFGSYRIPTEQPKFTDVEFATADNQYQGVANKPGEADAGKADVNDDSNSVNKENKDTEEYVYCTPTQAMITSSQQSVTSSEQSESSTNSVANERHNDTRSQGQDSEHDEVEIQDNELYRCG